MALNINDVIPDTSKPYSEEGNSKAFETQQQLAGIVNGVRKQDSGKIRRKAGQFVHDDESLYLGDVPSYIITDAMNLHSERLKQRHSEWVGNSLDSFLENLKLGGLIQVIGNIEVTDGKDDPIIKTVKESIELQKLLEEGGPEAYLERRIQNLPEGDNYREEYLAVGRNSPAYVQRASRSFIERDGQDLQELLTGDKVDIKQMRSYIKRSIEGAEDKVKANYNLLVAQILYAQSKNREQAQVLDVPGLDESMPIAA